MNKTFRELQCGDPIFYLSKGRNCWYLIAYKFNSFTEKGFCVKDSNGWVINTRYGPLSGLDKSIVLWAPHIYLSPSLNTIKELLPTLQEDISKVLNKIYEYENF